MTIRRDLDIAHLFRRHHAEALEGRTIPNGLDARTALSSEIAQTALAKTRAEVKDLTEPEITRALGDLASPLRSAVADLHGRVCFEPRKELMALARADLMAAREWFQEAQPERDLIEALGTGLKGICDHAPDFNKMLALALRQLDLSVAGKVDLVIDAMAVRLGAKMHATMLAIVELDKGTGEAAPNAPTRETLFDRLSELALQRNQVLEGKMKLLMQAQANPYVADPPDSLKASP